MHYFTHFIISALPKSRRTVAPLIWFGGKGLIADKLIPLIPKGKVYVEPYGGAANILFHREPVAIEVYNDLDENLVALFRALQDQKRFDKLAHRVVWTLYARKEYEKAVEVLKDQESSLDDRAWALFVAQNQGISGSVDHHKASWARAVTPDGNRCKKTQGWRIRLAALYWWHKRLTCVQIENRNALDVIQKWDSKDTVFYLDPPYVHSTRKSGSYRHEMDDEHHKELITVLLKIKGAVVLSGYDNPLYAPLEKAKWDKSIFKTYCFASLTKKAEGKKRSERIEIVWRNKRALELCREEKSFQGRSE